MDLLRKRFNGLDIQYNIKIQGGIYMPVIAHNLLSQFTNRQLNISTKAKGKSAEKLSSGYRINRAADDAAGLKISEKMRTQIRGLSRGEQNTQEGISWIQVGDGAMNEMVEIAQRIRELAVQASNDTNSELERNAIDNEIKQLRKEINMISTNTEFNKQKVFDNSEVMVDVQGKFNDLQVYNSTYDSGMGRVTYGGFIFEGNRVSWDSISQNMVSFDVNGNQVFSGGSYTYKDPNSGAQFQITCESGASVPKVTREFQISADVQGIIVDGTKYSWDELINEDGVAASGGNIEQGVWELNHKGASIAFFTAKKRSYAEMADAINQSIERYSWKMDYIGQENVEAVDATVMKNLRLSNVTVNMMTQDDKLSFTVKADDTGIWLEDSNTLGAEIGGSRKTWADLGIQDADWDTGNKISKNYTYQYQDNDSANDTYIAFDFVLDEVTSMDSVIDGLDGMVISGGTITNTYRAEPSINLDQNIKMAYINGGNTVYFSEEKDLGRDFDTEAYTVSDGNFTYDAGTKEIDLAFPGVGGNEVINYKGNSSDVENYLRGDLSTYINRILPEKHKVALEGGDPQAPGIKLESIVDILGEDAVTKENYFSHVLLLEKEMKPFDTMEPVDEEKKDIFGPGIPGNEYPAAFLDFRAIKSEADLYRLAGTGFNSDCLTCDNYYSIRFEDFSTTGMIGVTPDEDGYVYNLRKIKRPNSNRDNYTLQIDIATLASKGISTGEQLAAAMVEITSRCLSMHYSQYASKGSMFYVYDNRKLGTSSDPHDAFFDTVPIPQVDVDEINFELKTDDGRKMDLTYKYDFSDISDWIQVEMKADPVGNYVYINGMDNTDGYRLYDPVTDTTADRFTKQQTLIDKSNGDVELTSMQELIQKYTDYAIGKMLGNTDVELNTINYTYMNVAGDENQNMAVKSVFDTSFTEEVEEKGIHIQNSAVVNDSVVIPKFRMNTLVLNLYKTGTKTFEQAQSTIDMADDAIRILSDKRSLYGAWQNRLEHIYANSCNMQENAQASESRIRDTDMADEMVKYSKHRILEQAGQAVLAKSNQSVDGVLNLLGRV